MLPFDFEQTIREGLEAQRRPEDGLLHCSGDLLGSLRHAQLRIAGAPTIENPLLSEIRLNTGTMWHNWLEHQMHEKYPEGRLYTELKVNAGLPEGWGGTADYLVWSPEYEAFVLADLKTIKGEGIQYIVKDGAKQEHLWQVSAYWHALVQMGYPMVEGFAVMYLPMNAADWRYKGPPIEIRVEECNPLSKELLWNHMELRWERVQNYLQTLDFYPAEAGAVDLSRFVNSKLAPTMEREQKLIRNKNKTDWDLVLKPHYTTAYCPFPNELCDCNTQGQTKIGAFTKMGDAWLYEPREGYEDTNYEMTPKGEVLEF